MYKIIDVIAVNLTGVFNCTQAVAPIMKEQNYGMTKVWVMELGRFGITANCITPGFIHTAMTYAIPEEVRKQSLPLIPAWQMGSS